MLSKAWSSRTTVLLTTFESSRSHCNQSIQWQQRSTIHWCSAFPLRLMRTKNPPLTKQGLGYRQHIASTVRCCWSRHPRQSFEPNSSIVLHWYWSYSWSTERMWSMAQHGHEKSVNVGFSASIGAIDLSTVQRWDLDRSFVLRNAVFSERKHPSREYLQLRHTLHFQSPAKDRALHVATRCAKTIDDRAFYQDATTPTLTLDTTSRSIHTFCSQHVRPGSHHSPACKHMRLADYRTNSLHIGLLSLL